jgi:phosphoserine aminotransferase
LRKQALAYIIIDNFSVLEGTPLSERVYNFNPGPSTLPLPVLEQAQTELLDYKGTGMSVMELSHRSREYEAIVHSAEALFKKLAGVGDQFRVLFMQGGASMQFALVPLNFLPAGASADYIITGGFAQKAFEDAQKTGRARTAATTEPENFRRLPSQEEISLSGEAAYVHITSNNTLYGTQWHSYPDTGDVPLIADMSSDLFCRPFDAGRFSLIYAGAQKNLGPAGVTVVLIRKSMLEKVPRTLPAMLRYDLHAANNSLYNTPPSFSLYMVELVLRWLDEQGGLVAIARHNEEKAGYIYRAIDNSDGFYSGHAAKEHRSLMNVTFRLPSEELEKAFLAEAASRRLVGLKGHRSVGGLRASIYNAMSKEGCLLLAEVMNDFRRRSS